jgi:hypothetical protein
MAMVAVEASTHVDVQNAAPSCAFLRSSCSAVVQHGRVADLVVYHRCSVTRVFCGVTALVSSIYGGHASMHAVAVISPRQALVLSILASCPV